MLPTPELPKCVDYDKVYEPLEDSFLILDTLELELPLLNSHGFSNSVPLIVEIGSGSGIISTFVKKNICPKSVAMSTDVNPFACMTTLLTALCNNVVVELVQCDLLSTFQFNSIDILIFNPPYVPAPDVPEIPRGLEDDDKWLDLALDGGELGMVVTNRLLLVLKDYISDNGIVYLLFCESNKPNLVIEDFLRNETKYGCWDVKLVNKRKCGWEILSIYKFVKINR